MHFATNYSEFNMQSHHSMLITRIRTELLKADIHEIQNSDANIQAHITSKPVCSYQKCVTFSSLKTQDKKLINKKKFSGFCLQITNPSVKPEFNLYKVSIASKKQKIWNTTNNIIRMSKSPEYLTKQDTQIDACIKLREMASKLRRISPSESKRGGIDIPICVIACGPQPISGVEHHSSSTIPSLMEANNSNIVQVKNTLELPTITLIQCDSYGSKRCKRSLSNQL